MTQLPSTCGARACSPTPRRTLATLVVVSLALVALAPAGVARSRQNGRVSIGAGITGPSALRASVVARGLEHVSALAEDADGRIWVATATGEADSADGVYLLGDDGSASLVIDDVDAPLGLVWIDGALYVARRAGIERYDGFDGTAFADHHAVLTLPDDVGLVSGLALTGGGRLVTGVSAPCDSCSPSSPWSAAVVTVGTDGTDPHVLVSDVRAAVGFAVVPTTGALLATMNQRDDLEADTPGDWLSVIADGQSWGFPDCYGQGGSVCTGVPEPLAVLAEHAAVSGVAVVEGALAQAGGAATDEGAVVAEWMTGRVRLVPLGTADGARTGAVRFLTGFEHPSPVLAARDGALLVGDWGTGRVVRVVASDT